MDSVLIARIPNWKKAVAICIVHTMAGMHKLCDIWKK